jgi:hypothetical protein
MNVLFLLLAQRKKNQKEKGTSARFGSESRWQEPLSPFRKELNQTMLDKAQ